MGFGLLYIKRNLRCLYTAELMPQSYRGISWRLDARVQATRLYTSLKHVCLGNSYLDEFYITHSSRIALTSPVNPFASFTHIPILQADGPGRAQGGDFYWWGDPTLRPKMGYLPRDPA